MIASKRIAGWDHIDIAMVRAFPFGAAIFVDLIEN